MPSAQELRDLLEKFANDPNAVNDLSDETLLSFENLVSPYGTVPECGANEQYACVCFTNLQQEYQKRLLITAFVGYLYRRCDEYGRSYQETVENMDDMKKAERRVLSAQNELAKLSAKTIALIKDRDNLNQEYKKLVSQNEQNIKAYENVGPAGHTQEQLNEWRAVQSAAAHMKDDIRLINKKIDATEMKRSSLLGFGKRFVIRQFLDEQFRFNPDKHVRASYVGNKGKTYIAKFIPPKDTFHNFQTYLDQNYEELRGVTEQTYSIAKPDIDVAILPCGVFSSKEEADNFVERNKENVIADIRTLTVGKWNLIESFKANREKIEAYRGTIADDILKQIDEDVKIGSELMKNRVVRRGMENARQTMPPPEMVKQYMADKGGEASITNEQREEIYQKFQTEKQEAQTKLLSVSKLAEGETAHDRYDVNVYKFASDQTQQTDTFEDVSIEHAEVPDEPIGQLPPDSIGVGIYKFAEGGKKLKKSYMFTKAKKPVSL